MAPVRRLPDALRSSFILPPLPATGEEITADAPPTPQVWALRFLHEIPSLDRVPYMQASVCSCPVLAPASYALTGALCRFFSGVNLSFCTVWPRTRRAGM